MYMNLCDEQALVIKFNLTKETILQMPEKEIKFLLKQLQKEKEIDKNPILKNIVIVERLSNNDITWKFYKDYLLNKTEFKILSNVITSIDKRTLYKYIKRCYRIKWYGRYNDDICIIHKSKEFLINLLKQIKIGLSTIGLKINEIKTKMIHLKNNSFTILKTKYFYDKYKNCGKVIMLYGRKSSKIERRKLRKFKTKMLNKTMTFLEIFNLYKAWRKNILKSFNAYNLISRNDEYFKHLFNLKYANFKNKIYIYIYIFK